MFKATVKDKSFEINHTDDQLFVNGEKIELDIHSDGGEYFHILYNQKGYRVEMVKVDASAKSVVVKINGSTHTVLLKDKFDLLLDKMGMSQAAAHKVNSIKAPMPGLIIDLKIKAGDTVSQGEPLLILEAMKMENILKSPGDGVIKNVKVKKGDNVEKGQILIEF